MTGNDWTFWRGGPCPAGAQCIVEVEMRYAGTRSGRAADFRWTHDMYHAYGAEDIIRYRLISTAPEA